jgi:hypothetical protein
MIVFTEKSLGAVVLLLIPVALLLSTIGLKFADLGGAFSPVFFPRIILWLWIGLACLNMILTLWRRAPPEVRPLGRVGLLAILLPAYALAIMPAGFFLASLVFCLITLWLLGWTKPISLLAFSVGLPGALVVLFNHWLSLPLPTSPITYLF